MLRIVRQTFLLLLLALLCAGPLAAQASPAPAKQQLSIPSKHRIVIFVADG